MSDPKPRFQIFAAEQSPPRPRRPLDELGDLFFSAPAARDRTPSPGDVPPPDPRPPRRDLPPVCPSSPHDHPEPPPAEELFTPPALEPLLANAGSQAETSDQPADLPEPAVEVIALLAGGLPIETRDRLARLAACRLAAVEHDAPQPPVVTFHGRLATVSTLAGLAPAGDPVASLRRRAVEARRMVLIVAEHVGTFLDAGRLLPEHCVALVTPDPESLVEAYRELKVATAATVGPVPEVYVLNASAQAQAERTYRRLARVAIAHLGSTPTFAGAALETPGRPTDSRRHASAQAAGAAADRIYRAIAPLFGAPVDNLPPQALPDDDHSDRRPAAALTVEVGPAETESGQRITTPPIAGVVRCSPPRGTGVSPVSPRGVPPLDIRRSPLSPSPSTGEGRGEGAVVAVPPATPPVFTTWHPASTDELLSVVRNSITALLPGARGLVQLADLVRAPDRPDLLVADDAGRPVAVLVTDGRSADVLRRAVLARQWLLAHAPLLARAFPALLLDSQADDVRTLVLAPETAAIALESLCPSQVALVAWTPVALGPTHGLLFRQVLWPLSAAPIPDTLFAAPPSLAVTASPDPTVAAPSSPVSAPSPVSRRSVSNPTADPDASFDSAVSFDPGTSPDDHLSADEINDLAGPFELDELT